MMVSYLAVPVSLYGVAGHVGWRLVVSLNDGDGQLSGFLYMARKTYEREKRRAKWGGGPFVGLGRDFLGSLLLRHLTPFGSKLLLDLLSQYNGCNNGDLCITWSLMQHRGWSGKSTLEKAQKELIDCGLLVLSRQGGRNRPSLYALSLFSVDECKGKLEEIRPSESPSKQWQQTEVRLRAPRQKNTIPTPPFRSTPSG